MTTKERIVEESLSLFSIKGYKGTSVKNIADAVGIKDSSLYKHFKSKQEILDTIMIRIGDRIDKMSTNLGLPTGDNFEQAAAFYGKLDEEGLVQFSKKIFLFYLEDDLLAKFWRMGMMEQFQNDQVYALYRKFFMEDSIVYLTSLFAQMEQIPVFCKADPQVMAMNFYTPIFFLLSKYAGEEEGKEEALDSLDQQVREFYRIYHK